MRNTTIQINDLTFNVSVALSEEEKEQGLSNTESLAENSGMLFDFSENPESELIFNTVEMNYPIDIIFINTDDEVVAIERGEPHSEDLIECVADDDEKLKYVLEVNVDSGIKVGDEVEFEDDISEDDIDKMYILGSDGKPQMELVGGERIVSRIHTRKLIKLAKLANKTKSEKNYKKLGKLMFKILDTQNNQEPEYVKSPEGKDIETKKGE